MLALLDDIIEGRADAQTLELLERTAKAVQVGSLCGLGKTAPNPVLSTLQIFPRGVRGARLQETLPHRTVQVLGPTRDHRGQVQGLHRLRPQVPGRRHQRRTKSSRMSSIADKCIKCGACKSVCRFDAVVGV